MTNHEAAIKALKESREQYEASHRFAQERVNEGYEMVGRYSEQVRVAKDAIASITVAIKQLGSAR